MYQLHLNCVWDSKCIVGRSCLLVLACFYSYCMSVCRKPNWVQPKKISLLWMTVGLPYPQAVWTVSSSQTLISWQYWEKAVLERWVYNHFPIIRCFNNCIPFFTHNWLSLSYGVCIIELFYLHNLERHSYSYLILKWLLNQQNFNFLVFVIINGFYFTFKCKHIICILLFTVCLSFHVCRNFILCDFGCCLSCPGFLANLVDKKDVFSK